MGELYGEYSRGEQGDGSGEIPDRLIGCMVKAMVSSEADGKKKAIQVSVDTTISDATLIGMYLTFLVTDMSVYDLPEQHSSNISAFSVLMAARDKKCFPEQREPKNASDRLRNSIIDWLTENDLGFSTDCVNDLGEQLVSTLCKTFWILDVHWKTLHDRGHSILDIFQRFQDYNKPEASKHRKRTFENLKMSGSPMGLNLLDPPVP